MGKYATKEQLTALVADMASKINIASGTQGVSGSYVPIGCIEAFMGVEAPPDFLVCDGSLHSLATYPQLADHFYEQFGASNYFGGNGTTTFGVPNSTEWDTPTVPPNDTPVLWCIKAIDEKFNPGNIVYSTQEHLVGKWIDDKDLYEITYDWGMLSDHGDVEKNHGIVNIDKIIYVFGVGMRSSGYTMPIPFAHDTTLGNQVAVSANKTIINIMNRGQDYSDIHAYITLRYTKA